MIINADAAELHNTDLDGKSIGAVRDFWIPAYHPEHTESIVGKGKKDNYFNSGVLLFDTEKNSPQPPYDPMSGVCVVPKERPKEIFRPVAAAPSHQNASKSYTT
jgi:hypothetical protein